MSDKTTRLDRETRLFKLNKSLKLCEEYKERIIGFVQELEDRRDRGLLDEIEYNTELYSRLEGKSLSEWAEYYDSCAEKYQREISAIESTKEDAAQLSPEPKTRLPSARFSPKLLFAIFILFIFASGFLVFRPQITGFAVSTMSAFNREAAANYTDGYDIEGGKWAEIKGERMYERCLKVYSEGEFDSAVINAKATAAGSRKNLVLGLYNQSKDDEPLSEIGSCRVSDYSSIWKSCEISSLAQESGEYWICAYDPEGDSAATHYIIAYNNGGNKKTALWTGAYWQKQERSSYSMEANFIRWS